MELSLPALGYTPWATYTSDIWDTILAFSSACVDMGHVCLRDLYGLGESSELKLELKQCTSLGFIRGQTSGLDLMGAHKAVSRKMGEVNYLCAQRSAPLLAPIFSCWEGEVRTTLLSCGLGSYSGADGNVVSSLVGENLSSWPPILG